MVVSDSDVLDYFDARATAFPSRLAIRRISQRSHFFLEPTMGFNPSQ